MRALLTGDVAAAISFNALMVACLPYLLYRWVTWFAPRPAGEHRPLLPAWTLYSLPAAVLAFWVLRNIPGAPFSVLAP